MRDSSPIYRELKQSENVGNTDFNAKIGTVTKFGCFINAWNKRGTEISLRLFEGFNGAENIIFDVNYY